MEIIKRSEASAGAVTEVAIAHLNGGRHVTAVRDAQGNLKLIRWDIHPDTKQLERKGEASAGAISKLALVDQSVGVKERVATAVRDSDGNLKVILWDARANGEVIRVGEASAGAISDVALVKLDDGHFATAVRDSEGKLKLIVWNVDSDGKVTRGPDASAGAVSDLALAKISAPTTDFDAYVLTAVKDSTGNLKVIAWDINGKVERKGEATAGEISELDVMEAWPSHVASALVTAVRDAAGNLKLITWGVDPEGAVKREGSASAGAVGSLAVSFGGVDHSVATAVRDGSGTLKVILWEVTPEGKLVRKADASDGAVQKVAVAGSNAAIGEEKGRIVTAARDDAGNLKLVHWETAA